MPDYQVPTGTPQRLRTRSFHLITCKCVADTCKLRGVGGFERVSAVVPNLHTGLCPNPVLITALVRFTWWMFDSSSSCLQGYITSKKGRFSHYLLISHLIPWLKEVVWSCFRLQGTVEASQQSRILTVLPLWIVPYSSVGTVGDFLSHRLWYLKASFPPFFCFWVITLWRYNVIFYSHSFHVVKWLRIYPILSCPQWRHPSDFSTRTSRHSHLPVLT